MLSLDQWRERTAAPRQLARDILAKIADLPDAVRRAAIMWTPTENALTQAIEQGAASQGPLAGLPYALKDLYDLEGAPTTAGSSFLTEVRAAPTDDSRMVRRLRELGATVAAKTATVEFAYGLSGENLWYGDVPHPRIPHALAGGSSSGSAWAVCTGLTPFGIGTDTAGSMRVPAAYCGLFAWRDTPGPLTRDGCFPLAPSFDTPGWFAADPDMLLLLNDALLPDGRKSDQMRILDLSALSPNLDPALDAAGQPLLRELNAEAEADAVAFAQAAFNDSARAYNILGSSEAFQVHQDWLDVYRERYDPAVWARIDRGRRWSTEDRARAVAKKDEVTSALESLFERYDALAMPITPIPSPTKSAMTEDYRSELLSLTTPGSLARCPALTLPVKLCDERSGGYQLLLPPERAKSLAAKIIAALPSTKRID